MNELAAKVGIKRACEALGVSRSSIYRARQPRPQPSRDRLPPMPCRLRNGCRCVRRSTASVSWTKRHDRSMPPCSTRDSICAIGARCIASWRPMTKCVSAGGCGDILSIRSLNCLATAPNQVWSWDITYLRGPHKWEHYPLYTVLDIYSRYVVGWMIAEVESSDLARQLIAATALKQDIQPDQLDPARRQWCADARQAALTTAGRSGHHQKSQSPAYLRRQSFQRGALQDDEISA